MRRGHGIAVIGLAALLAGVGYAGPAWAQQPLDDVLGGFDEEAPKEPPLDPLKGFDDISMVYPILMIKNFPLLMKDRSDQIQILSLLGKVLLMDLHRPGLMCVGVIQR